MQIMQSRVKIDTRLRRDQLVDLEETLYRLDENQEGFLKDHEGMVISPFVLPKMWQPADLVKITYKRKGKLRNGEQTVKEEIFISVYMFDRNKHTDHQRHADFRGKNAFFKDIQLEIYHDDIISLVDINKIVEEFHQAYQLQKLHQINLSVTAYLTNNTKAVKISFDNN